MERKGWHGVDYDYGDDGFGVVRNQAREAAGARCVPRAVWDAGIGRGIVAVR